MEKVDTHSQLVAAAAAVIDDHGEGAVRLRDLAETVGVREPSIYHHFSNRGALIEAAQIHRFRRDQEEMLELFEQMAESVVSEADFYRIVREMLAYVYSPDRFPRRISRSNIIGSADSHPELLKELGEAQYEVTKALSEIFANAQQHGWIRQEIDPLMTAAWALGQGFGRIIAEIDAEHLNDAAWNRVATDAVIAVLRGCPD